MPDEPPDVIPCEVDPTYECVRLGSQVPPGTAIAAPPDPGSAPHQPSRLCPEGYVPRRRRRPYRLEGKLVRPDDAPTQSPG